ncbi:polysaccharide lyase 8 family protein [Georgenia subflava]|uniref:Hyaluronate lyase n=1 Tax=Georgenia subflava TaxID=1622177 RepID=A0A6N7ENN9_9MICO|nr:polysaccharide lyase 8 family protein [Georgenia subflava]MPV38155.1 hyaluronate lyase [Georgenia subflava]
MQLSRRQMFQGMGAVGIAALVGDAMTGVAHAAPQLGDQELQTLRLRWVDQLTGRDLLVPGDPDFAARIASADDQVAGHRAQLAAVGSDLTFVDLPFTAENNIRTTYLRIAAMATQWATPGSAFYGSEALLDECLVALRETNRLVYNPGQPEFGNWWAWEIGATRSLADTMALLRDHIDQADLDSYCAAIDFYVPDPWYQFPDSRGKQLSEGANRVDLCQAVIVRSIVGGDTERLAHAVAGLSATWQYVSSGNGFYRDGSFVQHSTIGYTGTYGLVLLRGLARLFALLAATSHDVDDPSRVILTDSVEESFAPLVYQGQMMDAVRGRAVSREKERSYDNGFMAVEAILMLARAVDAQTAERWRGRCRHWLESNDYTSILDGASVGRLALAKELLASSVAPVDDDPTPWFFPAMDRMVYRGEGWGMALAMCSNRIAWYECGNGENEKGYQTSQGMTYLYLADDDRHFDDEFWSTSDLAAPPGTTVDTTALPDGVEGQWGEATPPNEWTGGAVLDGSALAGQHLIGPGGTGLQARKTWWFVEDMVVALGSDITTGSGAEVKTVLEHRNLGTAPRRLLVDGGEVTGPTTLTDARWAHVEGVGGYVLLDVPALRASVRTLQGSWSRNNKGGSTGVHERVYATLEAVHEGTDTYAYVVLPTADAATTRARSGRPPVEVLRNDAAAQAVRLGRRTAVNFWQAGTVGDYTVSAPASVIVHRTAGTIAAAISDPTHQAHSLELVVKGVSFAKVHGEGVQLVEEEGGVRVVVDVAGRDGVPVELRLTTPR